MSRLVRMSVLGLFFGGILGYNLGHVLGYRSGAKAANEKVWEENCEIVDNFYLCKDLRGFNQDAVSVANAMKSAADVVELEHIERIPKRYKGKSYTVTVLFSSLKFGIKRDTKEPYLLLVAPAGRGSDGDAVVASAPMKDLIEKTASSLKEKCEEQDNCDEKGARIDALYPDAVLWAQKAREHIEKNFQ